MKSDGLEAFFLRINGYKMNYMDLIKGRKVKKKKKEKKKTEVHTKGLIFKYMKQHICTFPNVISRASEYT